MKKYFAATLAALLMLTALAGCESNKPSTDYSGAPETEETSTESGTPADTDDAAEGGGSDFDKAYAAYAPDTVMLNIGEFTVNWDELFLYLATNVNSMRAEMVEDEDWSSIYADGKTFAEVALARSRDDAATGKTVHYGAKQIGVSLSEDEYAAIIASYDENVAAAGSEEIYADFLRENFVNNREVYNYLMETSALMELCQTELFGASGEKLSIEDLAEYSEDDGYLMAKHILRMTQNDDRTEKTDEEKAVALDEINDIHRRLTEYDGDDFDAFFHELMIEHSEDPGTAMSPGGYLFQKGNMVDEFYDACVSMGIGEFSEPVKTSYGYHIVYRIPIDYDAVPASVSQQGYNYTLRYLLAWNIYESVRSGWLDNMEITPSEEFESLDIAKVFG